MNDDQKVYGISIEEFFRGLGLTDLSDERKEKYLKQFSEMLEGRIFLRLLDSITPPQAAFIKDKPQDEVIKYLSEQGVDVLGISVQESLVLKEELVSNISYTQGLIDEMKNSATD